MGRFQFEKPYVGESGGTTLARGIASALEGERARRREAEDKRRFDKTSGQADRRLDLEERRSDQDAIEAGFDLNLGGEGPGEREPDGDFDDGMPHDGFSISMRDPMEATATGAPAGATAPTANAVRHPKLGTRDYLRSTGGQQTILQDELTTAREKRRREWDESDRARSVGDLRTMGRSEAEAGAIVDRSSNYDDVVPEFDRPGFDDAYRRKVDIATSADITRDLARERNRRKVDREGGFSLTDLDRFTDNARTDYTTAQRELEALNRVDTMLLSPEEQQAHAEQVRAASERVGKLRTRFDNYRSAADSAFTANTGARIDDGGTRKPSPQQLERAQSDPEYAEFLRDQGYEIGAAPAGPGRNALPMPTLDQILGRRPMPIRSDATRAGTPMRR